MRNEATSCDTDNDARKVTHSIRCRSYDIDTDTFSIVTYTLDDVVIGGLDKHIKSPATDFTTHNEIYLIKSSGALAIDTQPAFKCIKVDDDGH